MESAPDPVPRAPARTIALQILDLFAAKTGVALDRLLAARAMGEAERAIPGDEAATWCRRLVGVGESVDLRVQTSEAPLRDALDLVRQGMPVAACLDRGAGGLQWVALAGFRGRRVLVGALEPGAADRWLTVRELCQTLGIEAPTSRLRWVVAQPAFACESVSHHGEHEAAAHVSPLTRLVKLLRPEAKDLWVIVVFSIVVGLLVLASPIAVEALVDTVAFGRYLQPVIVLAILLFTFLAFAAAVRALLSYIVEILQRRLFVRVVGDLAYRLPRVRRTVFDDAHGPELVNRFLEVATVQKVTATLLLDGIALVLQAAVGMLVLAFYHPFLLGFDIVLLLLISFVIFGLGSGAVKTAIRESKSKYAIAAWLEELARHPTAFKLHAGSQFALDRADQLTINWLEARRLHFRIVMRQILFALGLQAVAATALLGLGGWLVLQGRLTLGQLVAAELIVMVMVSSFAKLGKHMESFYDLLAAVHKLGHLFDLPIEPHDKLFHLRAGVPAQVALRDVSYAYHGQKVLHGVSLDVKPGESVAVVGPAGSGKSTLFELLCGMRQPASGHIELDGMDLRELRADALREHLALARSIEVFHGSIDENVHLNRPHISARDVREALAAVGLLDELLQLPDGLNTVVHTYGAPLSASQASRLMLARAMVDRPRLLLIDGTLDALPDDLLPAVLAHVFHPNRPWSVLVASGRQRVISSCERVIQLPAASRSEEAAVKEIAGQERFNESNDCAR